MPDSARPLAVVTGASTGIGYELARICAQEGHDLLIAADEPAIHTAATEFRGLGAHVDAVEADLATVECVDGSMRPSAAGRWRPSSPTRAVGWARPSSTRTSPTSGASSTPT